jgi:hypothetical protein
MTSGVAIRMIVARDTPCNRESSLIEAPALCLARISARCSAIVVVGPPQPLALLSCPLQPGLCPLHQKIPLELGNSGQHSQHHLASW